MKQIDISREQNNFINDLEVQGKSFNTLKNYRTDLNIFKEFLLSKGRDTFIKEFTIEEVKEYNHFLNKKYNSPNSIRRRVQALRIFFDYLIRNKLYDENPIKKVPVAPKVVDLPNPVSFKTIRDILKGIELKIEESSPHEKLLLRRNIFLFHLIYGAGLKVSDIENLYANHITKNKGIYRVLVDPEKREPYTVTLSESFSEFYPEYLNELEKGKRLSQIDFSNLLFNANPFKILSGGLSARGIEIIFKELSKEYNTKISAKSLRQACIFKWLSQDIPHSRIKEWMGVQPQYSLKPYIDLLKESPEKYSYMEQ